MVIEVVERVMGADVAALDRAELEALSSDLGRIAAWLESRRLAVARRLGELTPLVEPVLVRTERVSGHEAAGVVRRAAAVEAVPGFEAALEAGTVSVAHVQALTSGVGRLPESDRGTLAVEAARLVASAESQTPEQFALTVRRTVERLLSGDGATERLARQRAATTLRHWVDATTGMVCVRAEMDPERGIELVGRINNAVEALFHDAVPPDCPTDDRKHGHLQALGLLVLTEGKASSGRPCVVVVSDERTVDDGWHPESLIDTGSPAELPVGIVQRWAREGCRIDVTVRDGVVTSVHGDPCLDVGRTRRLATWKQRLALRVMHPTCAVPDCAVPASRCVPHHVRWWRHGGRTDLGNLVPVCDRHHHAVHDHGWRLVLDATTRRVTVTTPDGGVMTTGPPAARSAYD